MHIHTPTTNHSPTVRIISSFSNEISNWIFSLKLLFSKVEYSLQKYGETIEEIHLATQCSHHSEQNQKNNEKKSSLYLPNLISFRFVNCPISLGISPVKRFLPKIQRDIKDSVIIKGSHRLARIWRLAQYITPSTFVTYEDSIL